MASQGVDTVHLFVLDLCGDIQFEFVDLFDDSFDDREVAIDDGIEHAVEQVVEVGVCDFAAFVSKSLSQGIPAISGAFLEGDEYISFEDH